MLYLLQDCYKDESGVYHDILKIGFCKKDFKSNRESAYVTHNYGYSLLGQIMGDRDLESCFHTRFKDLLLPGSQEWFIYSEDIIKCFSIRNNMSSEILQKDQFLDLCRELIITKLIILKSKKAEYLPKLKSGLRDQYVPGVDSSKNFEKYNWMFSNDLDRCISFMINFWNSYDFSDKFSDYTETISLSEISVDDLVSKLLAEHFKEATMKYSEYLNRKISNTKNFIGFFNSELDEDKRRAVGRVFRDVESSGVYGTGDLEDYSDYVYVTSPDEVAICNNLKKFAEFFVLDILKEAVKIKEG